MQFTHSFYTRLQTGYRLYTNTDWNTGLRTAEDKSIDNKLTHTPRTADGLQTPTLIHLPT
jgi:hypothetical protein